MLRGNNHTPSNAHIKLLIIHLYNHIHMYLNTCACSCMCASCKNFVLSVSFEYSCNRNMANNANVLSASNVCEYIGRSSEQSIYCHIQGNYSASLRVLRLAAKALFKPLSVGITPTRDVDFDDIHN